MKKQVVFLAMVFLVANSLLMAAVSTTTISRASIPYATAWYMPVGDRNANIATDLKVDNNYKNTGFSTTVFPGNYTYNGTTYHGWYVYTNFNANKNYDGTAYFNDDYHPGEDWNGQGGGDTDLGQPIYAAAGGKVVGKGFDNNFGNMLLIVHKLPSGELVVSIYAHMQNPSPLNLGDTVTNATLIGYIGGTPNYAPHLHWEIRRENMLSVNGDQVSISTSYPANYWPKKDNTFIASHYYDPSDFIQSHIALKHPAGSLVRTANNSNLYMLIPDIPNTSSAAQKKVLIPSSSFGSEGINTSKAITITQKEMDSFVDAGSYAMLNKDNYPTIFRGNGDFLFKIGTPVYLYDKSIGKKRRVYTDKAMFSWGYSWSNVAASGPSYARNATDGEPLYYRDGALVRGQSNSAVYVLENGYKRAFQTYDIFAALGCKDANIVWLSDYDINNNVGIKGNGEMLTATNIWQDNYQLNIVINVYPPQNLIVSAVSSHHVVGQLVLAGQSE